MKIDFKGIADPEVNVTSIINFENSGSDVQNDDGQDELVENDLDGIFNFKLFIVLATRFVQYTYMYIKTKSRDQARINNVLNKITSVM